MCCGLRPGPACLCSKDIDAYLRLDIAVAHFPPAILAPFLTGANIEAAINATRAAAHYCNNPSLPVPLNFGDSVKPEQEFLGGIAQEESDLRPQIYLAGPFFNMMQRWMVHESRQALREQGLEVFSPFHDVGIGEAADIAPADLKGLVES